MRLLDIFKFYYFSGVRATTTAVNICVICDNFQSATSINQICTQMNERFLLTEVGRAPSGHDTNVIRKSVGRLW